VTDERPTPAPADASKLPPFKVGARAALPMIVQPLISALPSANADTDAAEAPPTLLFNDVSDDALVCDPNDPNCEVV
jgi:hypothetical protein